MRLKEKLQFAAAHAGVAAHVVAERGARRARLVQPDVGVCRAAAGVSRAYAERVLALAVRRWDVLRAELDHRRRCRVAGRALRRVEKDAASVVAETEAQMRALMEPQQLARYGPFALYDNALRGPDWEVSLQSVRAHLVEPGAVILRGAGPDKATLPPALPHPEREHLVVSGRSGVSAVECPTDDDRASRFARLVNVAALNSSRLDRRRRAAVALSAERLEETRAWALHRIGTAREEHTRALADRRRVEDAQRALVRTQLDTNGIDSSRGRLGDAKRYRVAARVAEGLHP